jgi:hypothetical protein
MIGYHLIEKDLIDKRLKIHYEIGKTYELSIKTNSKPNSIIDDETDNDIKDKPESIT